MSNTEESRHKAIRSEAASIAAEYFMACTGDCVSLTRKIVDLVELWLPEVVDDESEVTTPERTPSLARTSPKPAPKPELPKEIRFNDGYTTKSSADIIVETAEAVNALLSWARYQEGEQD